MQPKPKKVSVSNRISIFILNAKCETPLEQEPAPAGKLDFDLNLSIWLCFCDKARHLSMGISKIQDFGLEHTLAVCNIQSF